MVLPEKKQLARAEIFIGSECLVLFPGKYAWWEKEHILFIADSHFGKIAHFRKSGIGLPSHAGTETFSLIHRILLEMNPNKLVFLGDVFHSDFNQDFERFKTWRALFPQMEVDIVLGNHDKAGFAHLHSMGINLHNELVLGPFYCSHEPAFPSSRGFNLCGHLHPGVSLSIGHQHVKVPCFWKGEHHLCFPSFGAFTGSVAIRPHASDVFYAISGSSIRRIEGSVL